MRSGVKVAALLVILLVLMIVTLGGVASMYTAVRDTRQNTALLRYNARRNDCVRDVQGDADQEFRNEVAALLAAGRDPVKFAAVRDRMAKQPNWADTVKKACPLALKGS